MVIIKTIQNLFVQRIFCSIYQSMYLILVCVDN